MKRVGTESQPTEPVTVTVGQLQIIPRDDIDEFKINELSLMPEGQLNTLTPDEVFQLLAMNVDDINLTADEQDEAGTYPSAEGWDFFFGYGRLNLGRAVQALHDGARRGGGGGGGGGRRERHGGAPGGRCAGRGGDRGVRGGRRAGQGTDGRCGGQGDAQWD